ncbi:helix-turn-helix transcriptional regulator [Dactylosporangium sp. CS-033363]|uniref:helix-turn-helix transcriptional regulator n=1 Tax=Dactylosporangium sp. CS-033363 TaxID=3239935 RepID=UPI003D914CE7
MVEKQFRSRRAELASCRAAHLGQGATTRQIAHAMAIRFNVNARVAYRFAHGLTQQQVAERWNELWPASDGTAAITHKNISYWETWPAETGRQPSLEVLDRLARIYQCAAADLIDSKDHSEEIWTGQPPSPNAVALGDRQPLDVVARIGAFVAAADAERLDPDQTFDRLVQDLTEWAGRMRRRDVLHWLSWAASAAAVSPVLDGLDQPECERTLGALADPARVDATVIDHVDAVLWRCMRQDDTLGPHAALDTALAQRRLVQNLLAATPDPLSGRMLSLYANLSRFAGWLAFDLNNPRAAAEYYESARAAAHEAHDTELGAFVLCNMSHLATWQGQPRIGIDHAVAAVGWASQTPDASLQAYAFDVAARAYAMDRQETAALRAIERAKRALNSSQVGGSTHTYFYSPGQLASTESICYLYLGRASEGARIGEQALETIEGSFVRNLALASLRLGICHLRDVRPDVDRGVAAIVNAARLSAHNRSARLNQRLHRAWGELAQWADAPEVRNAREQISAYGVG